MQIALRNRFPTILTVPAVGKRPRPRGLMSDSSLPNSATDRPRAASIAGRAPQQIGLVVVDIDAALRRYVDVLGMGPWACFTHGPETVRVLEYHGRPAAYSMRVALSSSQPQIELIQPVTGPNIYVDWMEKHGEGLHHVAYEVASMDDGIAEMRALGYPLIQYGAGFGVDGDGAFAYFDTEADLAMIVELRVLPRRRVPEFTFPG
jgi:methylmalonyl-CoA/ethylmalonyl-CoA epimerase